LGFGAGARVKLNNYLNTWSSTSLSDECSIDLATFSLFYYVSYMLATLRFTVRTCPHGNKYFRESKFNSEHLILPTMADKKKRDWFATGESDNEDQGYDSERGEEGRGKTFAGRSSKRQRLDSDESDAVDEESENEVDTSFLTARESRSDDEALDIGEDEAEKDEAPREGILLKSRLATKDKTKLAKKLAKSQAKASKTGVLYCSRIPPFMKPHTIRHLLQPFASSGLERVFLTPEDASTHKSRVKSGGNKKKSFLDGWIEFASKREAKIAAEALNGKNIGGKKGGYYYDDVWNLKYLKGFKWRHLTEQIANENAERGARLRAEGARERREVREFLSNVERSKMLGGMEKKRQEKRQEREEGGPDNAQGIAKSDKKPSRRAMEFKQSEVITKGRRQGPHEQPSTDAQRVLSKIF